MQETDRFGVQCRGGVGNAANGERHRIVRCAVPRRFRAVKTLSGGETFLVSLSLALSLSGEICLRSRRSMEFFFLDEGFGTLDGKLVDTVMDVLTKLSKDFAVGLISHVEELKHRIENKILVTGANERHGSQIKIENF